jgi:predicted extracellular nuclease
VVPQPDGHGGDDAIRVAMIYRSDRVTRVNDSLSDTHSVHHRPPLAQAFTSRGGPVFSVVVSHFKSRRCDKATGFDLDQSDFQGCFNVRRVRQAEALVRWIHSAKGVKQHAGSNKVLLIGDLNAHTLEDPLRTLAAQGFVDQVARFDTDGHSYVYDAMAGRLDHVLASAAMSSHVERAMVWHINADEPSLLDFRTQAAAGAALSSASAYRSSDHDPVLTILRFGKAP